jgi:UDP-4-amino-4,6-dideoxy-N-acetyl-beta-L-altrosamine N-acetyltransferase
MLIGNYARLRILDSTDADYVRTLRNSPSVMKNFQYRCFISDLQQRDFVQKAATSVDQMFFIAETVTDDLPFGVYSFNHIDQRNQRGEAGAFLDSSRTGLGPAAVEAGYLLLDYGFSSLNLVKIVAEVLSENQRAIRFNEGLGFHLEARLSRHVYYDREFHDLLLLAIFREDFYDKPTEIVQRIRSSFYQHNNS